MNDLSFSLNNLLTNLSEDKINLVVDKNIVGGNDTTSPGGNSWGFTISFASEIFGDFTLTRQ